MAVPGVSSVGSAVGKGASVGGKAASAAKGAVKVTGKSGKAAKGVQSAGSPIAHTLKKSQGAAKSRAEQLKRTADKAKDPFERHDILKKSKRMASNKERFGDALDKQADLQKVVDDNMNFSGPFKSGGPRKQLNDARKERRDEENLNEKERVKILDKVPGVGGDDGSAIGKSTRNAIRRGINDTGASSYALLAGPAGAVAKKQVLDPIRKTKTVKKAKNNLAKEFVPKTVRKVYGRARRDSARTISEVAWHGGKGAVDGGITGGLPGAGIGLLKGAAKGAVRGLAQSKAAWVVAGIGAGGIFIVAFLMALVMAMVSSVAADLSKDWRYQVAERAVAAASTAKEYAGMAKDAAKSATEGVVDGTEWVVGAAASKAAGVADAVGGVRDGEDKGKEDEDESSDGDKDESPDEGDEDDKTPPKADAHSADNQGYPTFGDAPSDWETGDPVMVTDIGSVVVDYSDSSGYSINGKHIDLVSMDEEAKDVDGYTSDIELDMGTLAKANVFIHGKTAPTEADGIPDSDDDIYSAQTVAKTTDDDEEEKPDEDAEDDEEEHDEDETNPIADAWGISKEDALDNGLSEDGYFKLDEHGWMRFIMQFIAGAIREEALKQDAPDVSLDSGMVINTEGIGYVEDSGTNMKMADKAKKVYIAAFKKLPIDGIDEKVDEMFNNARDWWYGQDCAAEGSNPGGSGDFTGKGVPDEAIPWVENAAKHSESGIPAAFFAYIMDRETTFNPKATAGDRNGGTGGLFQMNATVWGEATDGGTWSDPDIFDPMVHTEYGAKYFDDRLETVRTMRKNNPDKPYAKDLTELEALMIAHNAGEGNLQKYPNLPGITRGYLEEFREKFKEYGGGEAGKPGSNKGGGDSGDSGDSSGEASGKLVKPQGKHPKTSDRKNRWGKFHAGTDYGMPSGTELPAMFDGKVTFNGWMTGYGNYVIVKGEWDGKELGYAYAHMTASKVKVGQEIKAGDLIGLSGNTGVGTGPHLHLELRTSDFTGPGRENNTADADKFLKSNGGEIIGGAAKPPEPGESDSCPGNAEGDGSRGSGDVSNEECGRGNKIEEGLSESAISVYRAVCAEFPDVKSYGGRRYSSIIGNKSDHYTGKAVDVMINDSGSNDSKLGDEIADFTMKNKDDLDVKYIIWKQRIWTPSRGEWKKMGDRGDETQNHFDHVHISVNS